jgi:hypothetical protein
MSVFTVITWMLFGGLFPISFFWLRRAWRIGIKKDYSYVALKRGNPPDNPQRFALVSVGINLIAGLILATVILLILIIGLSYDSWTAIAGTTIWVKFFVEFIVSRQAHFKRK